MEMNARRVVGLLVVASMLVASERDAAAAEVVRLTVPYVKQTKALCGGAAAAMVFRYWGDGQADPNQFAPLLDRTAGGIATDVFAQAIEDRGWRVVRFVGSVESVHDLLRDRRPVIVLLGEAQGRFHYVVVVGTTDDHIVVHDPARGPSRRLSVRAFVDRWQPAGFWALLVLPSATGRGSRFAGSRTRRDGGSGARGEPRTTRSDDIQVLTQLNHERLKKDTTIPGH